MYALQVFSGQTLALLLRTVHRLPPGRQRPPEDEAHQDSRRCPSGGRLWTHLPCLSHRSLRVCFIDVTTHERLSLVSVVALFTFLAFLSGFY